jgi:hypothetical protein
MPYDSSAEYGEMDLAASPEQKPKIKKLASVRKLILKSPGSMRRLLSSKKKSNRLSRMRPSTLMNDPDAYDDLSAEDKAKLHKMMVLELDL